MPGAKGLEAGRRLGLHDVPGGAARGGPAYTVSMRDVGASFFRGLFKHLGPEAVIRTQILPTTCVASSKHWHALQP